MRKLVFFLVMFAAIQTLRATDFTPAQVSGTINATISLTTTTNATGSAINVEKATYHTFVVIDSGSGTNTVFLDRSLDNSAWINFGGVTNAAAGTNEITAVGKWSYFRARLSATNSTVTVQYLGGN